MKLSLFACCLALFVSCATPAPTDSWSEGTLAIALKLEEQSLKLQSETSVVFGNGSLQRASALKSCEEIEDLLSAHSLAWRALYSYSATIENILAEQKLDYDKVAVIASAFNDLHGKLLQTKIAAHFGVDLNAHRQIVQGIQSSSNTIGALHIASLGIDSICRRMAKGTETIGYQLSGLNSELISLHDTDFAPLIKSHQLLLERQQRYQTAVNPRYDVDFELSQVAKELKASEASMLRMHKVKDAINKMFINSSLMLKQCINACYEWGLCSQSLSENTNSATQNFRLFKERAEVISNY